MKFLHVSGCLKVLKLHAMMNRGLLSRNPRILGVLLLVSCASAILYVMKWNLLRIESRMLRNTPTNTEATYLSQGSKGPDGTVGVQAGSGKSSGPPDVQSYQVILQQQEEKHRLEISTLKVQISQLQDALQQCNQPQVQETKSQEVDLEGFLQNQLSKAEVHTGSRVSSEYAVAPFQSFTLQSVYQLGSGLSRQPAEWPPQKDRRDELVGVVDAALSSLNTPSSQQDSTAKKTQQSKVYSKSDFVEGITRTEKDKGTLYELTFRGESSNDFRRLTLFRPFGPLMNVKNERVNKANVPINIVVPLSKRTDKFERFLNNFKEVGVGQDGHVHLTVVYFGKEQINETRRALENMAREVNFKNYTLLHRDEVFSRGRALDVGARAWTGGDVLLFFCDVDVYFTADFLNTCRLNSEPGKKVFYPVLFSQYNPTLIYGSPQRIPALKQQLVIKTDTGFWRDFGFGMTCLYRSDYTKSGGFNLNIKGWGGEDVQLYRKFINSNIIVVRVPSRGLFHLWHEKICTRDLPSGQYNSCLRSKALIEASYDKLAMLNLQHQMEKNKQ